MLNTWPSLITGLGIWGILRFQNAKNMEGTPFCKVKLNLSNFLLHYYRKESFLTMKLCRVLCNALIQPYFDYACSPWYYRQQSLSHLAPRIWTQVPNNIKNSITVTIFKNEIKTWTPENCPCRLCKTYVPNPVFLWFGLFALN